MKKYNVFDLDVCTFDDIADAVSQIRNLDASGGLMLTALNPEKIMTSMDDKDIKNILTLSDILYPDGIGVVKSITRKYGAVQSRIPGCELWEELVKDFSKQNEPIYILGSSEGVITKTVDKLKKLYNSNIVGFQNGYFSDDEAVIDDIINSNAKFVSVALGSPRQELFIARCKSRGVNAVMMGVGGSYDVFTENVKRAPKMWRFLGLEWLYRLLSQPTRVSRQVKLVRFLYYFLTRKF